MDYFNYFSNDRAGDIKIKIMLNKKNIFLKKKILIYGLGKSGISAFRYLNKKNELFLYDDQKIKNQKTKIKKKILNYDKLKSAYLIVLHCIYLSVYSPNLTDLKLNKKECYFSATLLVLCLVTRPNYLVTA